jgi:hypothetical protein
MMAIMVAYQYGRLYRRTTLRSLDPQSKGQRPYRVPASLGLLATPFGGPYELEKRILFFNKRSGNVLESKGSAWKTRELSGNVIENK